MSTDISRERSEGKSVDSDQQTFDKQADCDQHC